MNKFNLNRQQVIDVIDKINEVSIGYQLKVDDLLMSVNNERSYKMQTQDIILTHNDTQELLNMMATSNDIKPDIPQLKKRIKYCRNPMEKKKLQQELNQVYKEQKRRRMNK